MSQAASSEQQDPSRLGRVSPNMDRYQQGSAKTAAEVAEFFYVDRVKGEAIGCRLVRQRVRVSLYANQGRA
jgi:hypothetical protein